jgi:hypothetical protein
MNSKKNLAWQLALNCVPLSGVVFAQWNIFALIYSYWLETVAIVFFTSIMILTARKSEEKGLHFQKFFKYSLFNYGILLFYLLFIVTFIGALIAGKTNGTKTFDYLLLIDDGFRWMIISLFAIKVLELLINYFYSGVYKETNPEEYYQFFSARNFVIHIVIVVGVFAFEFFEKKFNARSGIIAFSVVFVTVKSIADFVVYKLSSENLIFKTEKE